MGDVAGEMQVRAHRKHGRGGRDRHCHPGNRAAPSQHDGHDHKQHKRDTYVGTLFGAVACEVRANPERRRRGNLGDVGRDEKVQ